MGLRDIHVVRREFKVGDQEFALRGLAFSDIALLVQDYGSQAALLFGRVQSGDSLDTKDVTAMLGVLAKEFPDMVAAAIALAADDFSPEAVKAARKLTFPMQLECIEAIFHLTFASEADVKKLIESVTRVIAGVSGALTTITSSSEIGTGVSDAA